MDAKPIYVAGPVSYGGAIDPSIVARNLEGLRDVAPDGKTWSDFMREGSSTSSGRTAKGLDHSRPFACLIVSQPDAA